MPDEDRVINLLRSLGSLERWELLQAAGLFSSAPEVIRTGSGETEPGREWVRSHHSIIIPLILRTIDPDDDTVVSLVQASYLSFGEQPSSTDNFRITFSLLGGYKPGPDPHPRDARRVAITDLTAASCALCELFIEIASANRPFGVILEPPLAEVSPGSISFTIGGTLYTSGLSLIVACCAGMIAAPVVGPIVGGALATAGAIELALTWKKTITENKKLEGERYKLEAETSKLYAEARKNDAEARKAYIESFAKLREMERERATPVDQTAASSCVPRSVVIAEAQRFGLTEGYANHVLNRTLPSYITVRQYCENIVTESVA
jgi:hypothetical protein